MVVPVEVLTNVTPVPAESGTAVNEAVHNASAFEDTSTLTEKRKAQMMCDILVCKIVFIKIVFNLTVQK